MCFFTTVEFDNGRVLNVNGSAGPSRAEVAEPEREDIFGTWLLAPANRSTSGPQPMMTALTAAGLEAVEAYDPFVDDPTFRCDPVAIRRVWFAPGTPLEITREDETVVLRFEWMDVERIVHLDRTTHPVDGERTSLGHSIGHFDGATLVVETANYSQGVLRQYVETPGEPTRGMLHSDALRTTERIWYDPESNRLNVEIEHVDDVFFSRPFEVAAAEYRPSDLELQPFNCQPENPDQTLIERPTLR
jgi:hypothetical protein